MLIDLLKKSRSYRRFDATRRIDDMALRSFIEGARYTPSGANLQKLRFVCITDDARCDSMFSTLKFAGYLKEWSGPQVHERPVAYIVICSDGELNTLTAIDLGISAEAIVLSAMEQGIGACMFRSYSSDTVSELIKTENMIPHLVIAFGYPTENVEVVDMVDGDVKYYRDAEDNHIVPKRTLDELIID